MSNAAIAFCLFGIWSCSGQTPQRTRSEPDSPLIDAGKPGVFIEYSRTKTAKEGGVIILEIVNNTRWKISQVNSGGSHGWCTRQ